MRIGRVAGRTVAVGAVGAMAMAVIVVACAPDQQARTPTAPQLQVEALTTSGERAVETVSVCHYRPEEGDWKLLSISQPALAGHLANHDDAVPGGTTTMTASVLDMSCVPVPAVACPCFTAADVLAFPDGSTVPPAILDPEDTELVEVQCADNDAPSGNSPFTLVSLSYRDSIANPSAGVCGAQHALGQENSFFGPACRAPSGIACDAGVQQIGITVEEAAACRQILQEFIAAGNCGPVE